MPLRRRLSIAYLILQSLGVLVWWIGLVTNSSFRYNFIDAQSENSLFAFAIGDMVLLFVLPIFVCVGIVKAKRWTVPLAWLHAGAALYATMWAISMTVLNPSLWLGGVLMLPLAAAALLVAISLGRASL